VERIAFASLTVPRPSSTTVALLVGDACEHY
jgi:hypothetical protein